MIGASPREPAGDILEPDADEASTDRELIERFLDGDEAAFTEIVRRHAGLVMGVCQRLLRHAPDAEDAFQATFLVLARKVRSQEWQESVAGWLHQTARRTALRLRAGTTRRREVELQAIRGRKDAMKSGDAGPPSHATLRELAAILDEELAALPGRFREAILLSQAEGLGRDEIAARLGISSAAVKDRLERGRDRLRRRLARRGVTVSAAALAAWLVPGTAQAAGSTVLATATAEAATALLTGTTPASSTLSATALAPGALKMMWFGKLKGLLVGMVSLLAVGGAAYGMLRDEPQRFEKGLVGRIVAADLAAVRPSLTIRLEEFDTLLNLDVAPQAVVWIAFERKTLQEVTTGQHASLRLGPDHRVVNEIHVLGPRSEVAIQSVEPDGVLQVVPAEDDEGALLRSRRVRLSADAILRIGRLPASPADLRPGMHVPLEFSADAETVNAVEAEADPATVREGQILRIDAAAKTIEVRCEDEEERPADVLLGVPTDARIVLDGHPASLADLRPGCEVVIRTTEDRQSVRAIGASRPEPDDPAPVLTEDR